MPLLNGDITQRISKAYRTNVVTQVASIGIYVQTYFLFRLYAITHRLFFVIPISVVLFFAYLSMILGVRTLRLSLRLINLITYEYLDVLFSKG